MQHYINKPTNLYFTNTQSCSMMQKKTKNKSCTGSDHVLVLMKYGVEGNHMITFTNAVWPDYDTSPKKDWPPVTVHGISSTDEVSPSKQGLDKAWTKTQARLGPPPLPPPPFTALFPPYINHKRWFITQIASLLLQNMSVGGGQEGFIFSRWVTGGGGCSPGILHVPVGGGGVEPVFISHLSIQNKATVRFRCVGLPQLYKASIANSTEDAMQAYLVADTAEKDCSSHAMPMPRARHSGDAPSFVTGL